MRGYLLCFFCKKTLNNDSFCEVKGLGILLGHPPPVRIITIDGRGNGAYMGGVFWCRRMGKE